MPDKRGGDRVKTGVYLEFDGKQYDFERIVDKARKDAKNNGGKDMKDLKIYVKPEDGKAYYTADNGRLCGDVEI